MISSNNTGSNGNVLAVEFLARTVDADASEASLADTENWTGLG